MKPMSALWKDLEDVSRCQQTRLVARSDNWKAPL